MSATDLHRLPLPSEGQNSAGFIADLALNRPDAANAFNGEILTELTARLGELAAEPACRALILRGRGKHFSAGADLAWMRAAAGLSHNANITDAERLTAMFEALATFPRPTIALVQGAAYGGAVGLAACCDVTIATAEARFCLSEVKLGLIPAVILPYLARRLTAGALRRWALSGRVVSAAEARDIGLVEVIAADAATMPQLLRAELTALLAAAPEAQAAFKNLHLQVLADGCRQGPHTAQAIAARRASPEAQAGLARFFAGEPAPWRMTLEDTWSLPGGFP